MTNSFLVSQFDCSITDGAYSDVKVMRSAAGYYIGTSFTHNETSDCAGLTEPGSRESEYFGTREAAQSALDNKTWTQRMHP